MVSFSRSTKDFSAVFDGRDKSGSSPDYIKNFLKDMKDSSKAKQLAIGAAGGWAAGYVAAKFGKIAATGIGASLLLIQLAKYNGYIEIDWKKFNDDMAGARSKIEQSKSKFPDIFAKIQNFASENIVLAGGFASGFLLGFAFA